MEVKAGFKKTEIGVIPEDWELRSIGDIALVEGGYSFNSKDFLPAGTYQVIKMSNLYGGTLDLKRSASFMNEVSEQEKHYLCSVSEAVRQIRGKNLGGVSGHNQCDEGG